MEALRKKVWNLSRSSFPSLYCIWSSEIRKFCLL